MIDPERFDARELFAALARHRVEYLTIGGIAIQAHGGQRLTHEVALGDLSVPIANRDDLLKMKRAAGRPQDLADIQLLESLDDSP